MSTRQRLIHAALDLFTRQGISGTTTRQIADLAEVNEVTLFRQFGNKYGLLLAVMAEAAVFENLGKALVPAGVNPQLPLDASPEVLARALANVFEDYASDCLQQLSQVPDLVRSIVGEADQYPEENRRSLGIGLTQVNQAVAQYFAQYLTQYLDQYLDQDEQSIALTLPPAKLVSILHSALLGYAALEFTSEFHQLWRDRQDFLDSLVRLIMQGVVSTQDEMTIFEEDAQGIASGGALVPVPTIPTQTRTGVVDLASPVVHLILQRAKKLGLRDYALGYVLFGAGVSAAEVIGLERSHDLSDATQHLLQVVTAANPARMMPVNQWILGKRYGSYTNNPLSKWLRSRKDQQAALFLNAAGQPITLADIQTCWQQWTEGLGQSLDVAQAQQTWFVEMLMRGMSVENLGILTGCDRAQLQPYAQRAAEKAALEQALKLDQKALER